MKFVLLAAVLFTSFANAGLEAEKTDIAISSPSVEVIPEESSEDMSSSPTKEDSEIFSNVCNSAINAGQESATEKASQSLPLIHFEGSDPQPTVENIKKNMPKMIEICKGENPSGLSVESDSDTPSWGELRQVFMAYCRSELDSGSECRSAWRIVKRQTKKMLKDLNEMKEYFDDRNPFKDLYKG